MANKGTPVRTVRVDNELWRMLEDRAAGNGYTSSEYLRKLIARDAGVVKRTVPVSGVPTMRVSDALRQTDRYLERISRRRR